MFLFSVKNAWLNYREFDLEGDLVGVLHTCYLSAQSFIRLLKLVWSEYDIVAMNEWKKKCVGLQRTWVSKRTVLLKEPRPENTQLLRWSRLGPCSWLQVAHSNTLSWANYEIGRILKNIAFQHFEIRLKRLKQFFIVLSIDLWQGIEPKLTRCRAQKEKRHAEQIMGTKTRIGNGTAWGMMLSGGVRV